MNVRRITRLINLLQILQSGGGLNIDGLSRACSVSQRTMFRDIGSLRAAGVPVCYDADRDGYTIHNSHFLPPINFTPDEAVSLVTIGIEMGRETGMPFFEAARSAAHKLEQCLPPTHRSRINRAARAVQFVVGSTEKLARWEHVFTRLLEARMARNVVQIAYELNSNGEFDELQLRTYCLLLRKGVWYAVGESSNNGFIRSFELARVEFIRELDIHYTIPSSFNAVRVDESRWEPRDGTGRCHNVQIRFDARVAAEVAEADWLDSKIIAEDSGSLLFNIRISSLDRIASWTLGFGSDAEVIAPAELRERVIGLAEAVVARYKANVRKCVAAR